jgi:hypothetical protein
MPVGLGKTRLEGAGSGYFGGFSLGGRGVDVTRAREWSPRAQTFDILVRVCMYVCARVCACEFDRIVNQSMKKSQIGVIGPFLLATLPHFLPATLLTSSAVISESATVHTLTTPSQPPDTILAAAPSSAGAHETELQPI